LRAAIASTLLLAACSQAAPTSTPEDSSIANAQSPQEAPLAPEPCQITGESTDADPEGLRVHAEPDLASRELGRLYPGIDPESYFHDDASPEEQGLVGAQFTIDRVAGVWLHIGDVDPVTDGVPADPPRLNFQGSGWVHASRVRLIFTSVAAHQRPDADSPTVPGARFSNGEDARLLVGCRGRWAKLRSGRMAGEAGRPPVEGWLLSESNRGHAEILRNSLRSEGRAR
jgi:hypothetical protein